MSGPGADAPTLEPLVEPYKLTAAEVSRFEEDGFIRLGGVLPPPTIRAFEPVITAKVFERNSMDLPMHERTTFQRAFLQVMNLWRHSDRVRQLVSSPRPAQLAADLMGVNAVRLYHDQALDKEPGGGITPCTPTSTTGRSPPTGPARSGSRCRTPRRRWVH